MKNKSTLLLIAAVIVLAAIAYFVSIQDENSGGRKAMSDFAIENTEEIDRIIITESNKNKAELELNDGQWMLNDKFRAKPENINLLLKTFKTMAVQSSVSSDMKKTIVANMSSRYKKVEVYKNNKLVKTYYIGSPTKDHYGTYMLLEKNGVRSSEPYVVHIPGFNGFLESRFYTNENDWKYSGIFVYDPLDIKQIKVEHVNSPEASYLISQQDKKVNLTNVDGSEAGDYNTSLVENYVLIYEKVFFNKISELSSLQVDSIKKLTPTYIVSVTDSKGVTKKVNFVLKKSDNPDVNPVTGKETLWDENYIFGYLDNESEVLVFQYFSLGNMFSRKSYFTTN